MAAAVLRHLVDPDHSAHPDGQASRALAAFDRLHRVSGGGQRRRWYRALLEARLDPDGRPNGNQVWADWIRCGMFILKNFFVKFYFIS